MAIDIWVVYLPLPTIWRLKLTPQKKWMLTASFAMGLVTAGVNLGRLIQILDCPFATDEVYCLWALTILALAEMTGGILVACIPTLGPLLRRRFMEKSSKTNLGGPGDRDGRALLTIGSRPMRPGKKDTGMGGEEALLLSQGNIAGDWP
ncbi:hypothetical protein VSDG_02824 [Cytospora chrysosperma]|uniref:Rhodopsin domain-containing protein n=1 Tax=Cytospora chrysosperma TaxID=252740 RepID=A0A423WCB3_CYTCH|nr:hypothetical protein VSDG_02824 [Valsa sordida]